jgi:hypothetical protein
MVGDIASMLMYRDWTVRTRDGSSHIIIVWPNIKELYKLERKKKCNYKLNYIKNKRETQENKHQIFLFC